MNCPACGKTLFVAERDSLELDCCPDCRGLWFDRGELDLLAERLGVAAPEAGTLASSQGPSANRICPRCDRRLEQISLGIGPRVALDRCPAGHGLWFDRGELADLVRQADGGGTGDGLGPGPDAILRFLGENLRAARDVPPVTPSGGGER